MTNQPNKATVKDGWELIGHSHQIADTGDYDGHYEITNGKISLLTQDDDDESLQPIVDALNNSGCKFYQNDWFEFENKMLKDENAELKADLEHNTDRALEISKQRDEALERVKELEGLLAIWVKQNNYLRRHSISDFDEIHDQTKKSLKK